MRGRHVSHDAIVPATEHERHRQHVLDRYHVVDTLPETVYDDLVRLAATICDTPMAVVSLIDRDRQWFKARVGLEEHETTRGDAICDHAIRQPGELLEVPDLAQDARFAAFPIVTGNVRARFYASMPLVTREGEAIGTMCVVDTRPRSLSAQQKTSLRALARIAMALLEAHRQQHQGEALAALQPAVPGPAAAVPGYAIAILELQDMAGAVRRLGERAVEKALQSIDQLFDACMRHELGDRVNRVTDSPEFVAMLVGDDLDARLEALRQAAARAGEGLGLTVLMGAARSGSSAEAMEQVYLRADEDLSLRKDEHAASRWAA